METSSGLKGGQGSGKRSRWTGRLWSQFGFGPASQIPRLVWILALGGFIASAGSSFVWPLTTIYAHFVLGKPLVIAGLALLCQAGASLLGQLLGGRLFDRVGGKPIILAGLAISASMLAIMGLVRIWEVYLAAITLLGFSYGMIDPSTNALIAQGWPSGGRKGFNLVYVARNAGVAVGTALGGLVASRSFTAAFLLNTFTALGYAVLVMAAVPRRAGAPVEVGPVLLLTEPEADAAGKKAVAAAPAPMGRKGFLLLAVLALGAALDWLAYSQWQAVVSVYMRSLGYAIAAYSLLWTINGLLIVVGQPLIAAAIRMRLRSLGSQLTAGSLLFAAAFLLIWRWSSYAGFALGMVVMTLGEMLVLPALPAAVATLAAPGVLGLYLGILGGAASVGRMFGPLTGGRLYDLWSPPLVLLAAGAVCAVAAGSYRLYGLVVRRRE